MSRVAVRANRSLQIARGNGVAMRAALVVVVDLRVTRTAGDRDVGLEGRTRRVFVAQDVVRSVAALAVGCHEETLFAEREAVDRIHVVRIDARQSLLGGHCTVAMALAA